MLNRNLSSHFTVASSYLSCVRFKKSLMIMNSPKHVNVTITNSRSKKAIMIIECFNKKWIQITNELRFIERNHRHTQFPLIHQNEIILNNFANPERHLQSQYSITINLFPKSNFYVHIKHLLVLIIMSKDQNKCKFRNQVLWSLICVLGWLAFT